MNLRVGAFSNHVKLSSVSLIQVHKVRKTNLMYHSFPRILNTEMIKLRKISWKLLSLLNLKFTFSVLPKCRSQRRNAPRKSRPTLTPIPVRTIEARLRRRRVRLRINRQPHHLDHPETLCPDLSRRGSLKEWSSWRYVISIQRYSDKKAISTMVLVEGRQLLWLRPQSSVASTLETC